MKNVNDHYYICENGHLTVGNSKRKIKCDQKIQEIRLVKKGRSSTEKEVIKETICNKKIIKIVRIPAELDFFSIWDPELIRAFMQDQTSAHLKEGFIATLQKAMTAMKTEILSLRKHTEVKTDGNK